MQRYIDQLIEDLRQAQLKAKPEPDFGNTYKEFERAMLEIENAPDVETGKVFGVSVKELPPPDKLNEQQIQQLVKVIMETFEAFGSSVELKDSMPLAFQYQLLRELFAEKGQIGHGWHFDFCTGWCPDCKIFDYCDSWKGTWTMKEIEKERKQNL